MSIKNPFEVEGHPIAQFKDEAWIWNWLLNNLKEAGTYIPYSTGQQDVASIAQRQRPLGRNCWLIFIEDED